MELNVAPSTLLTLTTKKLVLMEN